MSRRYFNYIKAKGTTPPVNNKTWDSLTKVGTEGPYTVDITADGGTIITAQYDTTSAKRFTMTDDYGSTWTNLDPSTAEAFSGSFNETGDVIMRGSWNSVFRYSTDSGGTFSNVPSTTSGSDRNVGRPNDDGSIWCFASQYRLYVTYDTFTTMSETRPDGDTNYSWNDIQVSNTGQYMYVKRSDTNQIYASDDSGVTWDATGKYTNTYADAVALAQDENILFFLSGTTIQKSTDSCSTSSELYDFETTGITNVCTNYNGQYIMVSANYDGGKIWYSNDYGSNFEDVTYNSADSDMRQMRMDDDGNVVIGVNFTKKVLFYSDLTY